MLTSCSSWPFVLVSISVENRLLSGKWKGRKGLKWTVFLLGQCTVIIWSSSQQSYKSSMLINARPEFIHVPTTLQLCTRAPSCTCHHELHNLQAIFCPWLACQLRFCFSMSSGPVLCRVNAVTVGDNSDDAVENNIPMSIIFRRVFPYLFLKKICIVEITCHNP